MSTTYRLAGTLHAAFVRSPHAHARIRGIDASAARALPGVHLILTYADLPEAAQKPMALLVPNPAITQLFTPQILVKDEACYAGEPIAMVVADTRHIAEDAANLVEIDYEPLPAASDCLAAIDPSAPRRARRDAIEHRGAHSVQSRRQRCGLRQGRARLQGDRCTPIAAARSSWNAAASSRCTTRSSTRSRSTSPRRVRTA